MNLSKNEFIAVQKKAAVPVVRAVQELKCALAFYGSSESVHVSFSGSGTYTLPEGKLLEGVVLVGDTGSFSIGTTPGGSEISSGNLVTGQAFVDRFDYYALVDTTIYFTGTFDAKLLIR